MDFEDVQVTLQMEGKVRLGQMDPRETQAPLELVVIMGFQDKLDKKVTVVVCVCRVFLV